MGHITISETIKYIDHARKKDSKLRSVQAFLCHVYGLSPDAITSDDISNCRNLRPGQKLEDVLASTSLSENEVIKNIRKTLRSAAAINYLNDILLKDIKDADNMDKHQEYLYENCEDFAARLYNLINDTLVNRESDSKKYSEEYTNAQAFDHEIDSILDKIEGIGADKEYTKVVSTLSLLSAVSDSIYDEIHNKKKRYHADDIDKNILSRGSKKVLTTYGRSGDDTKEMSIYLESGDSLFIVGEGGIGKTTLLVNKLNTIKKQSEPYYIPLFITLNNLKTSNASSSDSYILSAIILKIKALIKSGKVKMDYDPYKIGISIEHAIDYEHAPQKILLLLDGFNEISNAAGSALRDHIKEEIEELSMQKNVRIILTSREFYEHNKEFNSLTHIYACGIDNKTLDRYLTDNKISIKPSAEVYNLLHNPLFLLMYMTNVNNGILDASTRGAILYEFCNGNSSFYNELNRIKNPDYTDAPLPDYTPLLFDFVMPAIAARMDIKDSFYVDTDELTDIVDQISSLVKPFSKSSDIYFKGKYSSRNSLSALALSLTKDADKIIYYLVDEFSFIQQDTDNNLFFVHQYIKDYFSSYFRILSYRQGYERTDDLYDRYTHTLFDYDTIILTKEVADRSRLCDLALLKTYMSSCSEDNDARFINNLLNMLSVFNSNTLANITFKGIDFSSVVMPRFVFSDRTGKADFIDCTFSEQSFLTSDNSHMILRSFTVYDNRPAVCELIVYGGIALIRMVEIKSSSILYSSAFSFPNGFLYDIGITYKILLSGDNRYILIYSVDDIYEIDIYNLETKELKTHYCTYKNVNTFYSFLASDLLALFCDMGEVIIYDLTREGEDASPIYASNEYEDFFSDEVYYGDSNIPFHDNSYKSYAKTFNLHNLQAKEDDKLEEDEEDDDENIFDSSILPSFTTITAAYLYYDYLVIIYNHTEADRTIKVYSLKDNDYLDINTSIIEEETSIYDPVTCFVGDKIFFSFATSILEFNLETMSLKKVYSIDQNDQLLAIGVNGNVLYGITDFKILSIDISTGELLYLNIHCLNKTVNTVYSNSNYILLGDTSGSDAWSMCYRFDNRTITYSDSEKPSYIKSIKPISHDRIVIIYSSGHVAIVDAATMALTDCFRLPYNHTVKEASYNESKEHLALILYDNSSEPTYLTKAYLKILNTEYNTSNEFKEVLTQQGLLYNSNLCYTHDSKYLFVNNSGTIGVYDTDNDYKQIKEIIIDSNIVCMKAYDGYIVIIYKNEAKEGSSSDYNIMIVDIKDSIVISQDTPVQVLQNWDYKSLCANEIAPFIYEKIYDSAPINTQRDPNASERFFYYKFRDRSDYYQDGILIKCWDVYRPIGPHIHRRYEMTTHFAFINKSQNAYYALNKKDEFVKCNLGSNKDERTYFTPSLYIKNCTFSFSKEPDQFIENMITDNLGIIK